MAAATYLTFTMGCCRKSEAAKVSSDSVIEEQAPSTSASAATNEPQMPVRTSATIPGFTSLSVQVSSANENVYIPFTGSLHVADKEC